MSKRNAKHGQEAGPSTADAGPDAAPGAGAAGPADAGAVDETTVDASGGAAQQDGRGSDAEGELSVRSGELAAGGIDGAEAPELLAVDDDASLTDAGADTSAAQDPAAADVPAIAGLEDQGADLADGTAALAATEAEDPEQLPDQGDDAVVTDETEPAQATAAAEDRELVYHEDDDAADNDDAEEEPGQILRDVVIIAAEQAAMVMLSNGLWIGWCDFNSEIYDILDCSPDLPASAIIPFIKRRDESEVPIGAAEALKATYVGMQPWVKAETERLATPPPAPPGQSRYEKAGLEESMGAKVVSAAERKRIIENQRALERSQDQVEIGEVADGDE